MTRSEISKQVAKLAAEDQAVLLEEIWRRLYGGLDEEEERLIEERLAGYEADPATATDGPEAMVRLRQRLTAEYGGQL